MPSVTHNPAAPPPFQARASQRAVRIAAGQPHSIMDPVSAAAFASGYLPRGPLSVVVAATQAPIVLDLIGGRSHLCAASADGASDTKPAGLDYTHKRATTLAMLAECCGRWDDMASVMTELMTHKSEEKIVCDSSERSLLSIAFKNRLTSARGTLKMLGLVAEHENNELHLSAVQAYARVMEAQVLSLATQLLSIISLHQLPVVEDAFEVAAAAARTAATSTVSATAAPAVGDDDALPTPSVASALARRDELLEAVVFWYKLAADYCRYVSECHTDATIVAQHSDMALSYYSKARQYASSHMHPASPTLLGVALNFTVFLFEIRRCEVEAYEIAKGALLEAAAARKEDAAAAEAAATATSAGVGSGDVSGSTTAAAHTNSSGTGTVPTHAHAPLSKEHKGESEAVCALLKENLRVWGQVLAVSTRIRD